MKKLGSVCKTINNKNDTYMYKQIYKHKFRMSIFHMNVNINTTKFVITLFRIII